MDDLITITLKEKNIPEIMVGHGLTDFGIGRGNFITEKEMIDEDRFNVRAFHLPFIGMDDTGKSVSAAWEQNLLSSIKAFLPLPDYFDNATKQPKPGIVQTNIPMPPSVSYGLYPETPYYKFDLFARGQGVHGDDPYELTFKTCVAIFFELKYGVSIVGPDGKFRQPVGAKLIYENLSEEGQTIPYPFQITVNAVDGTAPFTYSSDGQNYFAENIFAFEAPTLGKIFVKDARSVVREYDININDWPIFLPPFKRGVLPQPE